MSDITITVASYKNTYDIHQLSNTLADTQLQFFPFTNDNILQNCKHYSKHEIKKNIARKTYFIVIKNNIVIGCARVVFGQYNVMDISELIIHHTYQNNGYGKCLLNYCINIAKTKGYNIVTLGVMTDNITAKDLYLSTGFKTFSEFMYINI